MRSATRKKIGKDKNYLGWLHSLPCVLCVTTVDLRGIGCVRLSKQGSPTEAAHVGERGLSQKCPDREAIPLCMEHHREGTFSAHRMGRRFWAHWGLDKNELIAALNAEYERQS